MTVRTHVVSSNLECIQHDEYSTLTVEFKNGSVYEYSSVPLSVFYQIINAPSVGSTFHELVVDVYPYRRIR